MTVDPKREYREAAVRSASPTGLIIMLYEWAIEDLRRIAAAIEENDIQRRTDECHHFLEVLNQLQGSLDMERGGDVAANLDRYYAIVRSRLIDAELKNSKQTVDALLNQFLSLHQAWVEVERTAAEHGPTPANHPPVATAPASHGTSNSSSGSEAEPEPSTIDWSA